MLFRQSAGLSSGYIFVTWSVFLSTHVHLWGPIKKSLYNGGGRGGDKEEEKDKDEEG